MRGRPVTVDVGVATTGLLVGLAIAWLTSGFENPAQWVPDLVAGWALIGFGVLATRAQPNSRIGVLLTAAGFAWFIPNLAFADVPLLAFAGAYGIFLHRGLLTHALLTYSGGRATGHVEEVIVVAFYVFALLNGVWRSELLTTIAAVTLVLVAARRYMAVVGSERRRRRTAFWLSVVLSVAMGVVIIGTVLAPGDVTRYLGGLLYSVAVVTTAGGLALDLMTRREESPDITDLVVELGQEQGASIRDSMARALGDSTLEIGYWSPAIGSFIDSTGHALAPETGSYDSATTTISDGQGQPVAMLIHHPSLLDDPALADAVGAAARLASVNVGLEAELRGQAVEIEASRRRLVMAGDDEQRRLEARLRSGPERRLVELVAEFQAFSLEAYTQSRAVFEDIEDRLSETVDELRHLAAGLHPRLLTDAGLAGALEELARRSSISTALDVRVGNLPSDLEATAYFICAEAMANTAKHAAAEHMNVEVSTKAGVVVVTVIDDGVGGANPARGTGLTNLHDRVEAHGGSLRVNDAIPHGTRLVAEFPLGDRH